MILIKYVNTTRQLAYIVTKGSFTRDRCTQLTLLMIIMTYTTFAQNKFVSVICDCESFISSMSNRAGESFAASASPRHKPVHCTTMIARKLNIKNAEMDFHAVLPPDSKLEATPSVKNCVSWTRNNFTITETGGHTRNVKLW